MSQNIPAIEYLIIGATMTSFAMQLTSHTSVEVPFSEIYLHDYEVSKFTSLLESSSNGITDGDRAKECFERSSGIVLIKTFREIEAKYTDYLSVLAKKKIVSVGPLVQDPIHEYEKREIIEWLNNKEPSSAVFVSFVSEYFLSKEEIQEMAYGLENSMMSFIWVVRFPQAMPMQLDQPPNARPVEELGVGVEVKRDMDGKLEREEVAKVIREVVVEKIGEGVRIKAKELKEKIRNKGDEEIDGVVQLVQICSKKNRH
ncbi:UDP-glucosyltransferase 29-like [Fagus crenata]